MDREAEPLLRLHARAMRATGLSLACALGALLFGSSNAAAQESAPSAEPPRTSGPGCPQASAVQPLDSATRFELELPAFELTSEGAAPGSLLCRVSLRVRVPEGIAVRLREGELGGTAALGEGTSGRVERSYRADGRRVGGRTLELTERFQGSFLVRDDLADPPDPSPWSDCSSAAQTRAFDLEILLRSEGGAARIAVRFARAFRIDTRACTP